MDLLLWSSFDFTITTEREETTKQKSWILTIFFLRKLTDFLQSKSNTKHIIQFLWPQFNQSYNISFMCNIKDWDVNYYMFY